jgi:Ca-activated chloride channel family protein
MSRFSHWVLWGSLCTLVLLLVPALVQAHGFVLITDADHVVRLPRPIIIYPPPYPPHPPYPPIRPVPPPPPPASYKVQELDVQARVMDQVAQVQVSQSFVNTGSRQLEVQFIFPLPYDGAVDRMTLLVDGRELPARLLKADEARRLYEDIVRRSKDPALLEWIGTGLFKTSVFPVPPGQKRTVSLRYTQLCRMQEGLTDFLFPLSAAKYTSEPLEKLALRVTVESQTEIKNVYSPTHAVDIQRPDSKHATVTFSLKDQIPTSDFRLLYDVGKGTVSTRVLSYRPDKDTDKDGYFILLASPEIKQAGDERLKKTVVFVIDRSGSMSGKKIEQVRAALKFVLQNLREGDLFNVIAYDSEVEAFRPELQKYDESTRKAALGFVEGLYAGGSTNIDAALRTALGQLQDSSRPNYVVFLTDGLPTAGVTNEMKIVENANAANKVRARIFAFGVGFDLNSRLLDKIVRDNHGQSEFVRPNEDIEDRVSRLYRRIEAPVMTDVKIEFSMDEHKPEAGSLTSRVYPKGTLDLFAGEQLVLVGRYKTPGSAKVVVSGAVGGKPQKFDFPAKLVDRSNDETNGFIEKLWAVRRVGEILEELDLRGKNDELVRELVELATRHGVITPYTSFLADERTDLRDVAAQTGEAGRRLGALGQSSGSGGFIQREFRGSLQRAKSADGAGPAADSFRMAMPSGAGGREYGPPGYPARAGARETAKPSARMGGGMGGMGGMPAGPGGGPVAEPSPALPAQLAQADKESEQVAQNIRQIGNRTFYRRSNQWIDSTVNKDQEKKAQRVKQFSDDYFALARQHGRTLSQYMVFDEPVMVNLAGQAYLIEP